MIMMIRILKIKNIPIDRKTVQAGLFNHLTAISSSGLNSSKVKFRSEISFIVKISESYDLMAVIRIVMTINNMK